MPYLLAAGKLFEWSLQSGAEEFHQLARLGDTHDIEVLRISSPGSGFDVAIRVHTGLYSDGNHRFLGPLLVLGSQFPTELHPVQAGIMIELRPKLRKLGPEGADAATVERIVQWCCSSHFKAVRVNSSGGRWVGYGHPSGA